MTTNDPVVMLPDPAPRQRIGRMLSALEHVCAEAAFRTQSATRSRLSLTTLHEGSMQEVVIRDGPVGGQAHMDGRTLRNHRSGRKVMTWSDSTIVAAGRQPLSRQRTMHDHRSMVARWAALWRIGEERPEPESPPQDAVDALAFCARHVAACMTVDGVTGPCTVFLRMGAGSTPMSIRIAASAVHISHRFVVDDVPETSRALSAHLAPITPDGWSFSVVDSGHTAIEPLDAGSMIVHPASPTETMRSAALARTLGLPMTLGPINGP